MNRIERQATLAGAHESLELAVDDDLETLEDDLDAAARSIRRINLENHPHIKPLINRYTKLLEELQYLIDKADTALCDTYNTEETHERR